MEKKEFREEFSQFMKQTGKSQKQVSKETGLSTSVISQFLDGKYTGDNGKVQDILNKFLSISKDRLNSVSEQRTILIFTTQKKFYMPAGMPINITILPLLQGMPEPGKPPRWNTTGTATQA